MDGSGHAWATGAPGGGGGLWLWLPVFKLMVGLEHQLGETVFEDPSTFSGAIEVRWACGQHLTFSLTHYVTLKV